jgi:hypothetical protein
MKACEPLPLMDSMRPLDGDGALLSVLVSTYALSLSDPPFFEQDFLPTLLRLGGALDPGCSSPANLERGLGAIYCGLVGDAHALGQGERPSLRVDVIPVGHQLYHAKVVLIHQERNVRLVISSANLTHEGFRRNREAAVVFDFHERSELPPSLLEDFASQWLARLDPLTTPDFRRELDRAVSATKGWKPSRTGEPTVRILWGGGDVPLWRQFLEAWPQGELLREWQICSPFWPSPGDADTPFDVFRRELDSRGANVAGAQLTLFAAADVPGPAGRPIFPFQLVEQLAKRGFEPANATICPVRLDALETEVPDGKAEDQRPLHAKWILLRGEHISLLLLGSANFTRRGLGVLSNPARANIEVCVLLAGTAKALSIASILPPVAEDGIVQWCDCAQGLTAPLSEIEAEPWPTFISGAELEVRWETVPVSGTLRVRCSMDAEFSLSWEEDDELVPLAVDALSSKGICTGQLGEAETSALLVRRRIVVHWSEPRRKAFFPINIASDSKPGLPAVLGQDPTEQELIKYFRGDFDPREGKQPPESEGPNEGRDKSKTRIPPGRELQNYVVRDFLESLYGMEGVLRDSAYSQRAFEQALLGEFSPVRLAQEIQQAFVARRRTATATGFQLFEVLRVIENLLPRDEKNREPAWFADTRDRAMEKLLGVVRDASAHSGFRESCNAAAFRKLVTALLKPNTAARWRIATEQL